MPCSGSPHAADIRVLIVVAFADVTATVGGQLLLAADLASPGRVPGWKRATRGRRAPT